MFPFNNANPAPKLFVFWNSNKQCGNHFTSDLSIYTANSAIITTTQNIS